jgi:hypothetical protein
MQRLYPIPRGMGPTVGEMPLMEMLRPEMSHRRLDIPRLAARWLDKRDIHTIGDLWSYLSSCDDPDDMPMSIHRGVYLEMAPRMQKAVPDLRVRDHILQSDLYGGHLFRSIRRQPRRARKEGWVIFFKGGGQQIYHHDRSVTAVDRRWTEPVKVTELDRRNETLTI